MNCVLRYKGLDLGRLLAVEGPEATADAEAEVLQNLISGIVVPF